MLNNEEIEKLIEELTKVTPDNLSEEGLKLFNKINEIIDRNEELEEELEQKDMQHELELIGKEEYTKASMGEIIEQYYTANEDCIPKSLIKEKIEENKAKSDCRYCNNACDSYAVCEVLKNLLKEG